MYPLSKVEEVKSLSKQGFNTSEISRMAGVSRAAIRSWLAGTIPGEGMRNRSTKPYCRICAPEEDPFPKLTDSAYAYLLGMYLGDGCLSDGARGVKRLRIALDTQYSVIIEECVAATSLVMPRNTVAVIRCPGNVVNVSAWSKHWPCLFPQHGRGKKHERPIVLEPWQREILDIWPWRFLRGLIHSDGSRFANPSVHAHKTYWYSRYAFSNQSGDILDLFMEYCEKARPCKRWEISVAKRDSVALMDKHIGPKR